ncbi:MAG: HAMP domain-containing sensor histidine kinase [Anaerolineales bacterium]|nr:MAG: HAMP domain-containing sensor histidine kinase [Anaerolineales bacterium]
MSASPTPKKRRIGRMLAFALFFIISALLFVGGAAALLYFLFSEYTGVRNIWLLACGAPVVVIALIILVVFNLYLRFGKPMENLFDAINAIEEGDLSVRVKENKDDMFSDLFKRFNKMVGELERADQQRRNLTADIAHELRTPLHIIQGNLEGVIDGVYQPTTEHIKDTLDETRLLTRLVNDLQTLSLAETGQLPLHPTRFLLADLIQDLTSSFASQAASLGIDLQTHLADTNQQVTADYDRLNQVLSNLISNALRHTPRGGTIFLETESGSNEERSVRIMVKDTGAGIASEDLPFIFDRFWRGDRSRSDRLHSGLGLAITKQLIQAHDGEISVQSEVGRRTTFTIELPEQIS